MKKFLLTILICASNTSLFAPEPEQPEREWRDHFSHWFCFTDQEHPKTRTRVALGCGVCAAMFLYGATSLPQPGSCLCGCCSLCCLMHFWIGINFKASPDKEIQQDPDPDTLANLKQAQQDQEQNLRQRLNTSEKME